MAMSSWPVLAGHRVQVMDVSRPSAKSGRMPVITKFLQTWMNDGPSKIGMSLTPITIAYTTASDAYRKEKFDVDRRLKLVTNLLLP
jgi:hypothetical protein